MRKKLLAFAFATLLTALFTSGPATAQGTAIVGGPNAQTAGYLTPAMVYVSGTELTYVGADIIGHNVVSKEYGPTTQPWCILFPVDKCPLFWSQLVSIGARPVLGLENAVAGQIYNFYCYPHPFSMKGQLVVTG